jgi:hypothetical protein
MEVEGLPLQRWAMIRLSSCVAAALAMLAGCAAPPVPPPRPAPAETPQLATSFGDQTPGFVPAGALDAVVPIYHPDSETLGSGTVVAPDRVLTAAHVVDGLPRDETGRIPLRIDGADVIATVMDKGDASTPHGDWALLLVEGKSFLQPAVVHEAARDWRWHPPEGTEILLVGYAAGFFPGRTIDIDAPTPSVRARVRETVERRSCWYAVGDELDLGGMSGGGVMVWNHEDRRAELIGVFRGYVPTETVTTETTRVMGLQVTSRETRTQSIAFMVHRLPEVVANPGVPRR